MRDPKFSKIEDQIDGMIAKGYVTEADIDAVYQKLDISYPEAKSYLNNRLAERQREEKLAAEENEILHKQVEASKIKSGKRGVVQTCPNCGATVQAGNAKCPECGYAFAGVEAVSSAAELDRRLSRIRATGEEADEQRAHIVSSFPIPNTREDMFEFLAATEQKAFNRYKDGEETALGKAYYEKFIEALNKAKISFPDDPATKMFEEKLAKDKKRFRWNLPKMIIAFILGLGLIGVLVCIPDWISSNNHANIEKEYSEWAASKNAEIETYSDDLNAKLDEIPTPTAKNWEECMNQLNRVTWRKHWAVEEKYKGACDIRADFDGLEYQQKEDFEKRRNELKKQIEKARAKATGESYLEVVEPI